MLNRTPNRILIFRKKLSEIASTIPKFLATYEVKRLLVTNPGVSYYHYPDTPNVYYDAMLINQNSSSSIVSIKTNEKGSIIDVKEKAGEPKIKFNQSFGRNFEIVQSSHDSGRGSGATVTADLFKLDSLAVINGGKNFTSSPKIIAKNYDGNAGNVSLTANVDGSGVITAVSINPSPNEFREFPVFEVESSDSTYTVPANRLWIATVKPETININLNTFNYTNIIQGYSLKDFFLLEGDSINIKIDTLSNIATNSGLSPNSLITIQIEEYNVSSVSSVPPFTKSVTFV